MTEPEMTPKKKKRPIVSGVIFFALGIVLLGWAGDYFPPFERSWPIFIIIPGIALIIGSLLKKRGSEATQYDHNVS